MTKKVSEIDDIFAASKGRSTFEATQPLPSQTRTASTSSSFHSRPANGTSDIRNKKKKKKNDKKKNLVNEIIEPKHSLPRQSSTTATPEVVVDPSIPLSSSTQQKPSLKKRKTSSEGTNEDYNEVHDNINESTGGNDEVAFADSRGNKHRKRTDDGLPIYDVDELKIGLGGNTPLCPIDCDCCF